MTSHLVHDDTFTARTGADKAGATLNVERTDDGRLSAWIAPPGGNDGPSVVIDEADAIGLSAYLTAGRVTALATGDDGCTHGGDGRVHPGAQGLHNHDASEARRRGVPTQNESCVQAGRVRGDNESLRQANQAFTAENARLRQQRDAFASVVEAAKALTESVPASLATYFGARGVALVEAVEALPKAGTTNPDERYLIWSQHHQSWWGPNRSGYRRNPADAGRYTLTAAQAEMGRGCYCCLVPEVPVAVAKVIGATDVATKAAITQATSWAVAGGETNKAYDPDEAAR